MLDSIYKIAFPRRIDDIDWVLYYQKGRLDVIVDVKESLYPVTFYDIYRCQTELKASKIVVEERLILIRDLNLENVHSALLEAIEWGFFDNLKPLTQAALEGRIRHLKDI